MKSIRAYINAQKPTVTVTNSSQKLQNVTNQLPISPQIFIIDAMNMFIRNFSVSTVLDKRGNHIGGLVGSLNSLYAIIRKFRPSRIIIVFEGDNSTARRKKLYKDYKANRKGKGVTNRAVFFNDDEAEESFNWQLLTFIQYLQKLPINLMSVEQFEADDVIGWLVTKSSLKSNKFTIVSTDGDYLQLVSESVIVFSPTKRILYNCEQVFYEFGIHSHNFLLYKTLIGDKSDNISGVKGLQLKTLLKIFPNMSLNEPMNVTNLLEHCENKLLEKNPYKVFNEIINSEELIKLNEQLMNLADIDIPKLLVSEIEETLTETLELNFIECTGNSAKHYMDEYLFKSPQEFFSEFNYLCKN